MSKPSVFDLEQAAVESVAEWLAARDGWDHIFRGRPGSELRADYRRRAAALLAGESWALPA